jgi:hypothetical protein
MPLKKVALMVTSSGGTLDLSPAFASALDAIFGRFDRDGDGVLSLGEIQAFARACNDGREFDDEELDEIRDFLDTDDDGNLTRGGFRQLYHTQTGARPNDTWRDLRALGFDDQLRPHDADAPPAGASSSSAASSSNAAAASSALPLPPAPPARTTARPEPWASWPPHWDAAYAARQDMTAAFDAMAGARVLAQSFPSRPTIAAPPPAAPSLADALVAAAEAKPQLDDALHALAAQLKLPYVARCRRGGSCALSCARVAVWRS